MKAKRCPDCAEDCKLEAQICWRCRHAFPPPPPARTKNRVMGNFIVVCLLILVWAISAGAFTDRTPAEEPAPAAQVKLNPTPEAVAARKARSATRSRASSAASALCLNTVRTSAKYPSKVDVYMLSHAITKSYDGNDGWQYQNVDRAREIAALLSFLSSVPPYRESIS